MKMDGTPKKVKRVGGERGSLNARRQRGKPDGWRNEFRFCAGFLINFAEEICEGSENRNER